MALRDAGEGNRKQNAGGWMRSTGVVWDGGWSRILDAGRWILVVPVLLKRLFLLGVILDAGADCDSCL
ncbi:MAG: hypothetical protein QF745_05260 [Planctomycetota bacterium]|jgi:hypothetical protein|nr:hypothetical protein [Planctomycetota bacterium]